MVLRPEPWATFTNFWRGGIFFFVMKAPEPVFIEHQLCNRGKFLERMEAVISGTDSTVAVTSRCHRGAVGGANQRLADNGGAVSQQFAKQCGFGWGDVARNGIELIESTAVGRGHVPKS